MRRADAPPPTSLEGQFLIAMPSLREGPFARSVVYMCAHRDDGAMGIVINQRAEEIDFGKLLAQLDIVPDTEADAPIIGATACSWVRRCASAPATAVPWRPMGAVTIKA